MSDTSKSAGISTAVAAGNAVDDHPPDQGAPNPTPSLIEKIRSWRHRMPLIVRVPLAVVFLMMGILGGFIPVLQGWVFVLAACWLLFPDHSERFLEKIKAKFNRKKS